MKCRNKARDPNGPNKENGYKRDLYRNTRDGKIAGVCAGFADYFQVPAWVARLVFVSLVIFTFQLAVIAYIVAIFMIGKRNNHQANMSALNSSNRDRNNKVFNYSQPVKSRLSDIRDRLRRLDEKVGSMESYVTSRKYQTNKDINEL